MIRRVNAYFRTAPFFV